MTPEHYLAPAAHLWSGRDDGLPDQYFHQIIRCHSLTDERPPPATAALLGFACDEGVRRNQGRPGCRHGPVALRRALAPLPLPEHYHGPLLDCGDVVCDDGDLEATQQCFTAALLLLLQQSLFPIVMGGGHEGAWPHFLAHQRYRGDAAIGVINFDAHWDMRPLRGGGHGTSGTSFRQMHDYLKERQMPFHYLCIGLQPLANPPALHQYARHCRAQSLTAGELRELSFGKQCELVERFLGRVDHLYLSFDLDVLAAAYAPGVSAPQPLGLLPAEVTPLLRYLAAHPKLIGIDIVELAPRYDRCTLTAKLAALLLATALQGRSMATAG